MADATVKIVFPSEMQAQAEQFLARLDRLSPNTVVEDTVFGKAPVPERTAGKPNGKHAIQLTGKQIT